MDYSELKEKWGRKSSENNSNTRLIVSVVTVSIIIVLSFAIYFQYSPKMEIELMVETWTDKDVYTTKIQNSSACSNGGPVLMLISSNITYSDGKIMDSGNAIGNVHFSDGTQFAERFILNYNATERIWKSDWQYFWCTPINNYYVNVTANDGLLTDYGIHNFVVEGTQ